MHSGDNMTSISRPSLDYGTRLATPAPDVPPYPFTPLLLALLLIVNLSLKLVLASDAHLHPADERYHALVAKNHLAHGPIPQLYADPALGQHYHAFWLHEGKDWSITTVWLHKQPVATWLMAASMAILGPTPFAGRLPSILLTTLAVLLTFLITRRIANARVALLAAYFHAIFGMLITLSAGFPATDHVDALFAAFIQLSIYLAIVAAQDAPPHRIAHAPLRRMLFPALTGLALGLALLTKWLPALVVLPVWLAFAPSRRTIGQMLVASLVAAVVFVPWQVYTHLAFPEIATWERQYNSRHLWEVLEYQDRPVYQYFRDMLHTFSLVTLPLVIAFFIRLAMNPRHRGRWAIAIWFLLPYAFFSSVATRMPNYVTMAAAAVCIMQAWMVYELLAWRAAGIVRAGKIALAAILLGLPLAQQLVMAVPPLRTNRWAWMDAHHDRNLARVAFLKQLESQLPNPRSVLFNIPYAIEAMFHTPFVAYDHLPTPAEAARLTAAGRPVVVILPPGQSPPADLPPTVQIIEGVP